MRFQGFVDQILIPIANNKRQEIADFAFDLRGGWEGWLQVECYWQLTITTGVLNFTREPWYPGGGYKADFAFTPGNSQQVTIWVELKTQRQDNIGQAAREFSDDAIKLIQNFPVGAQNYPGAVAVIPNGGTEDILTDSRAAVGQRMGNAYLNKIRYAALAGEGVMRGNLSDQTTWPNIDDTTVALFRSISCWCRGWVERRSSPRAKVESL